MADRDAGVLIVGAGPAGAACATTLRAEGYDGTVLLCGRDLDPPYERPFVSKDYLVGRKSREESFLHPPEFWERKGIELLTRTSVMKLDAEGRVARLASGEEVAFEHAVLATGANVRRLRVDGAALGGIHYLRALGNADAVRADAERAERVVLIGGSYIACEVAASLTTLGKRCTLVMLEEEPLSAGFGREVGRFFAGVLRAHGVELVTADPLARFEGEGEGDDARVTTVVTEAGRRLAADMVVMGTGAVPDVTLARAAGLELGDTGGVACSRTLATSAPGVWAAGDICEYDSVLHGRRLRIEHWEVARGQGKHVARAILGSAEPYAEVPYFWSDLADWASLEYIGPAAAWDATVVRGSVDAGAFTVFYLQAGRVAAALTVGRSRDLMEARRLMAERVDVSGREAQLADVDTDLAGF